MTVPSSRRVIVGGVHRQCPQFGRVEYLKGGREEHPFCAAVEAAAGREVVIQAGDICVVVLVSWLLVEVLLAAVHLLVSYPILESTFP